MYDSLYGLAGALIGAIIVLFGNWLQAHYRHKENKYLREIENLRILHDNLASLLKSAMSSISSFDKNQLKKDISASYMNIDDSEVQADFKLAEGNYKEVIPIFLTNRHILTENIRKDCDKEYCAAVQLLSSDSSSDELTSENKKIFIISFNTLSGLMCLGVIEKMELVSNKLFRIKAPQD